MSTQQSVEIAKFLSSGRQLRSSGNPRFYQLDHVERPIHAGETSHRSDNTESPRASDLSNPTWAAKTNSLSHCYENMAESFSLGPPMFNGTSQDAKTWLENLEHFIAFKGIKEDKQLALFKLRLGETARDWLTTLPDEEHDSFEHLKTAFLARFQPRDLEKFRYAKDIFNIKQQPGQTVDTFITDLKLKASKVNMDAQSQLWIAMNGLLPHIASYVIEHTPKNLEEVLQYARIAEMTRGTLHRTDDTVTQQLDQLTKQMSVLTSKLTDMTAATIEHRESRPSVKHVSFREQRSRTPSPADAYNLTKATSRPYHFSPSPDAYEGLQQHVDQPINNRHQRPTATQTWQARGRVHQGHPDFSRERTQSHSPSFRENQQSCSRCGSANGHTNPRYCPMFNKKCFTCDKFGHSFRYCRSQQTRPSQYRRCAFPPRRGKNDTRQSRKNSSAPCNATVTKNMSNSSCITLKINQTKVRCLIDSGSFHSIIAHYLAQRLRLKIQPLTEET